MGQSIVFCGFMGAGKTEAARAAAAELGTEALDTDAMLEAKLGMTLMEFFQSQGEPAFREHEEKLVLRLLQDGEGVISLGGGAVLSAAVREALAGHVCAWCGVDEPTAWERSRGTPRPLASKRENFSRRYLERQPLYEQVARAVLPEGGLAIGQRVAPWLEALKTLPDVRMIWARSSSAEYPAVVGPRALDLLPESLRWFRVADSNAFRHHSGLLPGGEATIEVEAAEERKTLAEAERVLRELAAAGARRDDGLLAFGGGMVGDLGGFCAAVYQRGMPLVQAPTTLLAMVDSAYGGKTGVDLPEGKNYLGAYHMPLAVLADPATLTTLPGEELAAGFVEVLKTGLIAGGKLWDRVSALEDLTPDGLADVVFDCARTKIDVVAADERDGGRRAVLNLGHTVGHAIEAATSYSRYRHGEAIGLGLLSALRLSDADSLRAEVAAMLQRHHLPVQLAPEVDIEAVLAAVERDKKQTAEGLGFVLIERPGEPRHGQEVDPARVRAAVEELHPGAG